MFVNRLFPPRSPDSGHRPRPGWTGLEEGETVIIGPFRTLRDLADGDEVEVIEDDEEEQDNGVTVEVSD